MINEDLKTHYESGHEYSFPDTEEELTIFNAHESWSRPVLEIGCGDGRLAHRLWESGADVLAVDYVSSDNWRCLERDDTLRFVKTDYKLVGGEHDTIVMKGVLEHMDDPLETLRYLRKKHKPKHIITSSPSFLNPRGYVWMTFQYLLGIEMSMADLHFICPFDFEEWAKELQAELTYESCDQDWGHGKRLLHDFQKRLDSEIFQSRLKDALGKKAKADVPRFINWLSKTLEYRHYADWSGANIVYHLNWRN